MTRRSLAVAAAMALAMSQPVFRHSARSEPTDYLPPQHASHDAERIAKAEAQGIDAQRLLGHTDGKMTRRYLRDKTVPVVEGPRRKRTG